jgi:hypothetical protein
MNLYARDDACARTASTLTIADSSDDARPARDYLRGGGWQSPVPPARRKAARIDPDTRAAILRLGLEREYLAPAPGTRTLRGLRDSEWKR